MGKYYAVRKGRQPGVYTTWSQCESQTKGFGGAQFKSWSTYDQAEEWVGQTDRSSSPSDVVIYTDGSCRNNRGGWAYVEVKDEMIIREMFGSMIPPTTNNQAELMAIKMALLNYPESDLIIRSDSEYAINCVSVWCKDWIKRGWKKSNGHSPENISLIQEIISLQNGRVVIFQHVYGHSDNPYNERCDALAKAAY